MHKLKFCVFHMKFRPIGNFTLKKLKFYMNQFSRIFYLLSFDFTDLAWYIIFRTVPCDFGACPVSSNFLQRKPSSRACVEKKNVLKKKSGKNGQVKFFLAQGLISSYPHMPAHSSLEAKMMAHAMKALDPNVTGQKIADGVNQKFGTSHNRDWASSKKTVLWTPP